MMETIVIKNSSAIAKIVFNNEKNIVETNSLGESIGKLIHSYRKDGTLEAIVDE
jgi:hypothetical protein